MPIGRRKKKENLKNANKKEREKEDERTRKIEEEREKEEEKRGSFILDSSQESQQQQEAFSISQDKLKDLEDQVESKLKKKKEEEEKRKLKRKEAEKKKREEEALLAEKKRAEEERKLAEMTEALRLEAEVNAQRKKKEEELNLLEGEVETSNFLLFSSGETKQNESSLKKSSAVNNSTCNNLLKTHLNLPQRGKIDQAVDAFLDSISYSVPIRKRGTMDGTYLFGCRIVKLQLSSSNLPVVALGNQKLSFQEFIERYEKVELLRERGLKSAVSTQTMLGILK